MKNPNAAVLGDLYQATGCPHRAQVAPTATSCPKVEMEAFAWKAEFYGILQRCIPQIVDVIRGLREQFPHGLVKYIDGDHAEGNVDSLESVVNGDFVNGAATAREGSFVDIIHFLYGNFRNSLFISGDIWQKKMEESNDPMYRRLQSLIREESIEKYGPEKAVQRRVAAATGQTINVGCGFQQLIDRIYDRDFGRKPTKQEMISTYRKSKALAILLAGSHISHTMFLEKIARTERDNDGQAEFFTNDSLFFIQDGELALVESKFLPAMLDGNHDTTDGRFGCPGSKYIAELWDWLGDISEEFAFGIFEDEV